MVSMQRSLEEGPDNVQPEEPKMHIPARRGRAKHPTHCTQCDKEGLPGDLLKELCPKRGLLAQISRPLSAPSAEDRSPCSKFTPMEKSEPLEHEQTTDKDQKPVCKFCELPLDGTEPESCSSREDMARKIQTL